MKIQPKHSGKALDVDKVSSEPKAVINQWANGDGNNQLWRFLDLGTGYYQIQSVQSGHVIDILPGSAILQICQNTRATGGSIPDTQQWKLEKDGDYYKIISKSNGKVITVDGASNSDGAIVRLADDQAKDNQRMKIEIRNLSKSEFTAAAAARATTVTAAVYSENISYDLHTPGDINISITWGSASTVTEVVYNGNPVAPDSYAVTGNILTIKDSYLAALGLANGSKAEFTVSFDQGDSVKLTVNIVDSSAPASPGLTNRPERRSPANGDAASEPKAAGNPLTAPPEETPGAQ
ncbi:Ricin-type beta-trefoil lectin domain protein [compost metagenome]